MLGANARHLVGQFAASIISSHPQRFAQLAGWHTAGINLTGSFLLGIVLGLPLTNTNKATENGSFSAFTQLRSLSTSRRLKLLFGTGFCGSFTTFSTYTVDVVNMMTNRKAGRAFSYICLNNIGGCVAAFSGLSFVQKVCSRP